MRTNSRFLKHHEMLLGKTVHVTIINGSRNLSHDDDELSAGLRSECVSGQVAAGSGRREVVKVQRAYVRDVTPGPVSVPLSEQYQ